MKFTLNIETDNAALVDDACALAEILEELAEDLRSGYTSGHARDYNGNSVGLWKYVPEEDYEHECGECIECQNLPTED